jgi:hypothetical protein
MMGGFSCRTRGRPILVLLLAACQRTGDAPRPASGPGVTLSAPVELTDLPSKAQLAFHAGGDGFASEYGAYAARVAPSGRLTLTPRVPGARAFQIETAAIGRGTPGATSGAAALKPDGTVALTRAGATEELQNLPAGLEQRWRFAAAPAGGGDLTVLVRTGAAVFVGATATGLHFTGDDGSPGFRYGRATWIDARGVRTAVPGTYEAGSIRLQVPAGLVDQSAYPVLLDPILTPETAVDAPVIVPQYAGAYDTGAVAFDGSNYLVAWIDGRVRAVRVRADGTILDPGGITISSGQTWRRLSATFDGTQFIVAWAQWSQSGTDHEVRFARIALDGTVLDPGGVLVGSDSFLIPEGLASTSAGTSLLTWTSTGGTSLGTRLTRGGTMLDNPPLTLSSSGSSGGVVSDGTGFFALVFGGSSLAGVAVGADGTIGNEIPIVPSTPHGISGIALAFGGGQYLVTWLALRADLSNADVFGARIDTAGTVLDPSGITIDTSGAGYLETPAVAFTGTDFLVAWKEGTAPYSIIGLKARHVSPAGVVSDPAFTIASTNTDTPLALGSNGIDTVFAEFGSTPLGSRISGDTVVDAPGIPLLVSANAQHLPAVASDGTNYLVVWLDQRYPNLRGVLVGPDGTILSPGSFGIGEAEKAPHVVYGNGEYVVTIGDFAIVQAYRVGRDGTVLGGPINLTQPDGTFDATPEGWIAYDAADQKYLLAWTFTFPAPGGGELAPATAVNVELLDGAAQPITGTLHSLTAYDQYGEPTSVAFDGTNFIVAWDFSGPPSYGATVRAARVAPDGTVLDPVGGFALTAASGTRYRAQLTSFAGRDLAAWLDSRGSLVYGTFFSGNAFDDPAGFPLSSPPGSPNAPALASDGTSTIALWQGSGRGLFASWLAADGSVLYQSGFPIETETVSEYAVADNGAGQSLAAYSRYDAAAPVANRVFVRLVSFQRGVTCQSSADCGGGPCVDGMCCDSTCGGGDPSDCLACSIAAGGQEDGVCTTVRTRPDCLPNGASCDDGNPCTIGDTVQAGVCTPGAPAVCTAQDQCHVPGTCDPATGLCSNPNKADGTTCYDGNSCTTGDACQNGVCAGTPVRCNTPTQCQQLPGACSPSYGICFYSARPNGTACNDGNACTQTDSCQSGSCVGSNPVVCTALDDCHSAGACTPSTGQCTNPAKPDGTACSIGFCVAGQCTSVPDAGAPDAASPDASPPDASVPDASVPDASTPDASLPPDGSPPDASPAADASLPDGNRGTADAGTMGSPDGGCGCEVGRREGSPPARLPLLGLLLSFSYRRCRRKLRGRDRRRNDALFSSQAEGRRFDAGRPLNAKQ